MLPNCANGQARNPFFSPPFRPTLKTSAKYFSLKGFYTVVLYPSCASYKSALRKSFAG